MANRRNSPNKNQLQQMYMSYGGSYRGAPVEGHITDGIWRSMVLEAGRFAFCPYRICPIGFMSVRREGKYWYAFRSIKGKTKKRYIGKDDKVFDLNIMHVIFEQFVDEMLPPHPDGIKYKATRR